MRETERERGKLILLPHSFRALRWEREWMEELGRQDLSLLSTKRNVIVARIERPGRGRQT